MAWNQYNTKRIALNITLLIIGLILKFPKVLESLPAKYNILGHVFTESQYAVINIVSIFLIIASLIWMVVLLLDRFKR